MTSTSDRFGGRASLDLFRRLKPLYGKRIDALWIEHQLGDVERKREIEALLTMLAVKRTGLAVGDEKIMLDPPPRDLIGKGEIILGNVTYPGLLPFPCSVKRNDLLRHMFLLGPTGTGKSTLIINILEQLLALNVPFLVLDFKRNYRCITTIDDHVTVYTLGRNTNPPGLNALQPPTGVTRDEWIEALADSMSDAYLLLQGARNVLKEALTNAATLDEAHAHARAALASVRPGSRRYGWLESATRTLDELTSGALGQAINHPDGNCLSDELDRPVIVEMEGLGDDQKRFFSLLVLQTIMMYRKAGSSPREQLQHVLVFDEAHNVFPKERPGELGIGARLAREIREYGEAIITATQQTDINESIIANTGTKIILRTDYPRDTLFASQLLNIPREWLPRLTIGAAIIRLPRWHNPFTIQFNENRLKNTLVPDAALHTRCNAGRLPTRERVVQKLASPVVTDREESLLRDVATIPISPITHRYQRLGWHMETGNRTKDAIIGKGLARFDAVSTPRGQVKILTLTTAGLEVLAAQGVVPRTTRSGGPEHEYWKHEVRSHLERHGFAVVEEHPLGGGKTADLRAEKNGRVLFIEIETGRSDIPANLAKYAASDELVVLFTSDSTADRYRELVGANRPGTTCLTPREVENLGT